MADELAITNARIWTADPARPWARCLTVRDGVITSIDDEPRAESARRRLDARGRAMTPGLIDTHVHLLMAGESLGQLDLSGVRSRRQFEQALARRHAAMLESEQADGVPHGTRWLRAHGWSQENWGGALPDKSWLAAAGDRPVVAVHPRRGARRPHPPDRALPRRRRLHPLDGHPRRARRAQ
ncbi:MAG: amidohydrolase family protein, partial [Phycisphaerales bacterium]|nr:amidohydrolase family protein [Phycisphaerales bacterium]